MLAPRSVPPPSSPAQGQDLAQVTITMLFFGFGAALPLVLIGTLSRQVMIRSRGRMLLAGGALKGALGLFLAAAALLVLTGLDKAVEAALVSASPEWLTQLTTRF